MENDQERFSVVMILLETLQRKGKLPKLIVQLYEGHSDLEASLAALKSTLDTAEQARNNFEITFSEENLARQLIQKVKNLPENSLFFPPTRTLPRKLTQGSAEDQKQLDLKKDDRSSGN